MKIVRLETFLANAGLRNYLFVRLTTDTGLTGVGEASLEWQERAVQVLLHEWVEPRLLGRHPFDIEAIVGGMVRDQYQGGSTVMTAISGAEIALWDLVGKACGQPVYKLLGGRCHDRRAHHGAEVVVAAHLEALDVGIDLHGAGSVAHREHRGRRRRRLRPRAPPGTGTSAPDRSSGPPSSRAARRSRPRRIRVSPRSIASASTSCRRTG